MRVAIVHYDTSGGRTFNDIVKALATGIQRQGHDVTLVDARTEAGRSLTSFGYIAVGVVPGSVMAKNVPGPITAFLKSAGHVSGKRCYAFVGKKGLRKARFLTSLMRMMESEGMLLKRSDVLGTPAEAEAVGSRLHIEKTAS